MCFAELSVPSIDFGMIAKVVAHYQTRVAPNTSAVAGDRGHHEARRPEVRTQYVGLYVPFGRDAPEVSEHTQTDSFPQMDVTWRRRGWGRGRLGPRCHVPNNVWSDTIKVSAQARKALPCNGA